MRIIKGLAILQNIAIFCILIYQTVQRDVPARVIFNFSNPLFIVFVVFIIPILLVENIIESLNKDEDKCSQKKILILTVTFALLFIGGTYLLDPKIGFTGVLVGLFVTLFLFLIMQVVNSFRQ